MPNVGRPPKPVEQKRKTGNPGRRKLPDEQQVIPLRAITAIPEPPRPLFEYGRTLWDRVWAAGASWISPDFDLELLLMVCEQTDERIRLRASVWNQNRADERRALRALEQQIVNNMSKLGFSPTDRSRLGIAEVKIQSKLEMLRDMKNKRANG